MTHLKAFLSKEFNKEKWSYLFYTLSHPVDGYYWIRHEDRGSVGIAFVLVILFSLGFSVNRMLASFVVNDTNPRDVNTFTELIGVLFLFILICVGNWSITCLMEGEGRMKDILVAVGYATAPLSIVYWPATLISYAVADNEQAFYKIFIGLGIAYAAFLLLTGIMEVHNYTLAKTILTLFLTLVAVFIIIFLILLLANMLSQLFSFFKSIYLELIFRL